MVLSNLSVRRPVLMTMVIMTFVVMGLFSYFRLVVDLMPEVDLPFVTITTVYPGAGPEEIEIQVSKKIEDAVSNISNVKRINSTSRENLSLVFIEFSLGVDVDLAANLIAGALFRISYHYFVDNRKTSTTINIDKITEDITNVLIPGIFISPKK